MALKGTEAERQFSAAQAAYFHSLTYEQQMELERREARVFNGGLLLGAIGGVVLGGVGVAIAAALSKD